VRAKWMVSRVHDFSRHTCEIGDGYDVVWPVTAPVFCKNPSDHSLRGHVPEPVGIQIHKLSYKVGYGWDAYEVVKRFYWGRSEDSSNLTYPLVLCHLHLV
jgi:hypothetical protein